MSPLIADALTIAIAQRRCQTRQPEVEQQVTPRITRKFQAAGILGNETDFFVEITANWQLFDGWQMPTRTDDLCEEHKNKTEMVPSPGFKGRRLGGPKVSAVPPKAGWMLVSASARDPGTGNYALIYTGAFMDYLWTPWRYAYITGAKQDQGCVFCDKKNDQDDRRSWIVFRGEHCYICLNAFPYTSGHVMVIPYDHLDELRKLPAQAAREMMDLCQRTETILRDLYRPDGINLGMNIGAAAGAGVAGHIHMHVLPRWIADANFMTVVSETRILPETLDLTWNRIRDAFKQ